MASLYLLDAIKRRGVGRALFTQFMSVLAGRGFTSCGLWTLSNNVAARRFYEAMGGRSGENGSTAETISTTKTFPIFGTT